MVHVQRRPLHGPVPGCPRPSSRSLGSQTRNRSLSPEPYSKGFRVSGFGCEDFVFRLSGSKELGSAKLINPNTVPSRSCWSMTSPGGQRLQGPRAHRCSPSARHPILNKSTLVQVPGFMAKGFLTQQVQFHRGQPISAARHLPERGFGT